MASPCRQDASLAETSAALENRSIGCPSSDSDDATSGFSGRNASAIGASKLDGVMKVATVMMSRLSQSLSSNV
jgi:hypothetical protein